MTALFSKPKLPSVPAPEPKPEVTSEDVSSINEDIRRRQRLSRGRRSTIVTGGQGVQGQAQTLKTKLAGY